MSARALEWVWGAPGVLSLPCQERWVLFLLADMADEDGRTEVRLDVLAMFLGIDSDRLTSVLVTLMEHGLICGLGAVGEVGRVELSLSLDGVGVRL